MKGDLKMDSVQHLKYLDQETKEGMEELMDYDSEIIIDLLDTYIESSKELFHNLEMAVFQKQMDEIRECAHSLKSSSAQVGALKFSSICQLMEDVGKFEKVEETERAFKGVKDEFPLVLKAILGWKDELNNNVS